MNKTLSLIEITRNRVKQMYLQNPTGCGNSFGEILCHELRTSHLKAIAKKWYISLPYLGELIADHCRKL